MSSILKIITTATIILAFISYLLIDKTLAAYFVNNAQNIKPFFSYVTNFGLSQYYLMPSILIFLIFIKFNKKVSNMALFIFLSVATSGILSILIKMIFARYRPPMLFSNDLYGFSWFDFGYLVNSFPSGHSTTAFSAFVGFALLFPRFKWLFIAIASLIAFSRVILGVHFLSDILMGALLGTLTSYYLYISYFRDKV